MARIGIVFGLLLCGLSMVGMSVTTQKSYTQFVPMMFGIPMLFLGVVSLNPHRRSESVFFALILSLSAAALGAGRLVVLAVQWIDGRYVNPISLRLVLLMTTLSLAFALIAWLWRRGRDQSTNPPSDTGGNPAANESPSPVNPPNKAASIRPESGTPGFSDNPYQSPPIFDEAEISVPEAESRDHRPGSSNPPFSTSEST